MVFTSVVVASGATSCSALSNWARRVGGNRAANRHLNEGRRYAVQRRSRLCLRQAEVHFGLGHIGDLSLFHVANDADDAHLRESSGFAHAEGMTDGVLAGEKLIDESLVHDHYRRRSG